jgi:hypothetical protein
MSKFTLIILLVLLAPTRILMAQELVDEIDLEVVRLLSLDQEQAIAYSTIMQRQRVAFRSLKIKPLGAAKGILRRDLSYA